MVSPAIPAPTTQTSARTFWLRAGAEEAGAVADQIERLLKRPDASDDLALTDRVLLLRGFEAAPLLVMESALFRAVGGEASLRFHIHVQNRTLKPVSTRAVKSSTARICEPFARKHNSSIEVYAQTTQGYRSQS